MAHCRATCKFGSQDQSRKRILWAGAGLPSLVGPGPSIIVAPVERVAGAYANVRFSPVCFRFTPDSGRGTHPRRRTVRDPKETLALPQPVDQLSLTTLREMLIEIGAKVVRHGRYLTFQLAEVAIPRDLFAEILRLIDGLRPAPLPP